MSTAVVPWRVPAAVAAAGALIALAATLPARMLSLSPEPAAVVSGPELTLTGDGATFTLRSGVPAYWEVGVTTHAVQVTALLAAVTATGPLVTPPEGTPATTLALDSCTQPWQVNVCPGTRAQLVPATALGDLTGEANSLAGAQGIPANVYLLATVLMPSGAASTVGEDDATVTIHVTAAGDTPTTPPARPAPGAGGSTGTVPGGEFPPRGSGLASTGSRVGASAALAVSAVGVGALLAALGRRRRRLREEER